MDCHYTVLNRCLHYKLRKATTRRPRAKTTRKGDGNKQFFRHEKKRVNSDAAGVTSAGKTREKQKNKERKTRQERTKKKKRKKEKKKKKKKKKRKKKRKRRK